MRRRLTTLKAKQGHSHNGAPRTLIELAVYREHRNNANVVFNTTGAKSPHYDSEYSGWSNGGGRPRDQAISLRSVTPRQG